VKRRQFFGAAAAALAATTWPAWLREAFGDGPACDRHGKVEDGEALQLAIVAAAFRRAQRAGRPLLVLVIPTDSGLKWERGHAFGELLNHGSDKDLAPLADAEVVGATVADLAKLVPAVGQAEPLMLLVDTQKVPATVRALDAPLPSLYGAESAAESWEATEKAEERAVEARIATLARLLRTGLGSSDERLAARAAEVRRRLRDRPPPGTHWARSSGCGTDIEDAPERSMMVACGMGHVPAKSARFLYFYSLDKSGR
jgi:hypothetical protein